MNEDKLREFVQRYKEYSREKLIQENLLSADAPPKGGNLIEEGLRSEQGNELLQHAKDMRADNVVLEIEYGEVEGERIGDGVVTALKLINNIEINEELLYGRMENIEQSTLVS